MKYVAFAARKFKKRGTITKQCWTGRCPLADADTTLVWWSCESEQDLALALALDMDMELKPKSEETRPHPGIGGWTPQCSIGIRTGLGPAHRCTYLRYINLADERAAFGGGFGFFFVGPASIGDLGQKLKEVRYSGDSGGSAAGTHTIRRYDIPNIYAFKFEK